MIKLFNRTPTSDPLTTQLREQAQSFDPAPPAGLHRRIISTLALADAAPRPASHSRAPWLAAAGTLAAAAIVAIVLLHNHPTQTKTPNKLDPLISMKETRYANPLALALQYVDDPLQGEVQNLLNNVTRASSTVTHVFPAASKRQLKPTTQAPAKVTGV